MHRSRNKPEDEERAEEQGSPLPLRSSFDSGVTSSAPLLGRAARLVVSGPESGHHLHAFTLPDAAGRPVQLRQYLQRSNVMLCFHHGIGCAACDAMLRELTAHVEDFRSEETVVLAIGPDQHTENQRFAAQLGDPFPLLSDPAGRVSAQQGLDTPSLMITDRWGEIWAAWICGADHWLPSAQDILQWLVFIEAQCPECTMVEWRD